MTSFLDQLNLRPHEKRLVVFVGIILFAVLNIWLVWPHFGDWSRIKMTQFQAERTLRQYKEQIAKTPLYEAKLRQLQQLGSKFVAEDQELDLVRKVQDMAFLHQVHIEREGSVATVGNTKTNQFFEEQSRTIQVTTGNDELINFLVALAGTNSLIRVKDLNLYPGPTGTNLVGHINLVASYQKKTSSRATPPPRSTVAQASARTGANPTRPPATNLVSTNASTTGRTRPLRN
jgi:hypothetical protein